MSRALVFGVALAAADLLAGRAHAYCRTTTVPLDASVDDPSVSGQCWAPGIDIAWPDGRVPFGVSTAGSKYFTAAQVTPVADQAFAAWNAVTCGGASPTVQAYDIGLLAYVPDGGGCTVSSACDAAGSDVIVFDDALWPHDDPNNTLALTTVTYGVEDGRIFQAYTEVNTAQKSFVLSDSAPPGSYSLPSVLTHEAGHFLGLAHSTHPTAMMWASYTGGTQLTPDDETGLCAIYAPRPSSGGCASVPAGTGSGGVGLALGASALVALRRRRSSATRSFPPGGRTRSGS